MKTEIYSIFSFAKNNKLKKFSNPIVCNIYYVNYYKDLINDSIVPYRIESFFKKLDQTELQSSKNIKIFHLFYEAGLYLQVIPFRSETLNFPLAIEIEYTKEMVVSRHVISGSIGEHSPQHAPNRHRKWTRESPRRHTKYIENGCGNGSKNLEREADVLH